MASCTTRNDFIQAIRRMPYGDLRQIAYEFAKACEDKEARPKMESAEDFAELLWDWAEAQDADHQ